MALSVGYVRQLVRSQAVLSDTGAYGTNLNSVWLDQRDTPPAGSGSSRPSSVWGRRQDGTRAEIPGRTYTLHLQLQPYLINAERVPDVGRRAELLCGEAPICPTSGAVIDLSFVSLIKGSAGLSSADQEQVVDCTDVQRLRQGGVRSH